MVSLDGSHNTDFGADILVLKTQFQNLERNFEKLLLQMDRLENKIEKIKEMNEINKLNISKISTIMFVIGGVFSTFLGHIVTFFRGIK